MSKFIKVFQNLLEKHIHNKKQKTKNTTKTHKRMYIKALATNQNNVHSPQIRTAYNSTFKSKSYQHIIQATHSNMHTIPSG